VQRCCSAEDVVVMMRSRADPRSDLRRSGLDPDGRSYLGGLPSATSQVVRRDICGMAEEHAKSQKIELRGCDVVHRSSDNFLGFSPFVHFLAYTHRLALSQAARGAVRRRFRVDGSGSVAITTPRASTRGPGQTAYLLRRSFRRV